MNYFKLMQTDRYQSEKPHTSTIHVSAMKHSLVLLYRALSTIQHTKVSPDNTTVRCSVI